MEKIMSKTNETTKLGPGKLEDRALADSELAAVTGGAAYPPSTLLKLLYPT
jgi:hypothetical protein